GPDLLGRRGLRRVWFNDHRSGEERDVPSGQAFRLYIAPASAQQQKPCLGRGEMSDLPRDIRRTPRRQRAPFGLRDRVDQLDRVAAGEDDRVGEERKASRHLKLEWTGDWATSLL